MRESEKVRNYVSTNEIQVRACKRGTGIVRGCEEDRKRTTNENRSDIAS